MFSRFFMGQCKKSVQSIAYLALKFVNAKYYSIFLSKSLSDTVFQYFNQIT